MQKPILGYFTSKFAGIDLDEFEDYKFAKSMTNICKNKYR